MILQLFVHFKDQNCIFYDKGGHHENKICLFSNAEMKITNN